MACQTLSLPTYLPNLRRTADVCRVFRQTNNNLKLTLLNTPKPQLGKTHLQPLLAFHAQLSVLRKPEYNLLYKAGIPKIGESEVTVSGF